MAPRAAPIVAAGRMVSESAVAGGFTLFAQGQAAPIFVSAADHAGVVRVANDFQLDVERVSGVKPVLTEGDTPEGANVVVIGTLGKNSLTTSGPSRSGS